MMDDIIISPLLHMGTGGLALITTFVSLVVAGWMSWKKRPFNTLIGAIFIVTQLTLMLQILVGVKLLDQGFGTLQLYIHYLGGMAPIAFFLGFYWLRMNDKLREIRVATAVAGAAFLFVFMSFAIGSMYVAS